LASSQTTFCVVYIDNGSGPQYYGVYTLVEEVDDTVLESQFNNDEGNLYKPDGDAASFASGTFDESEMEKKSNEAENDYSDVESLYNIINSSDRTTDIEKWKSNLNTVLNVDGFLKWLAANTVMQNWDTYGKMTHNYYLYNNPDNNLLTWIPWDNNEALQNGKMGNALSLSLSEVGNNWPLIRYLMDVDEYEEKYKVYAKQFIDEVFIPSDMVTTYAGYYELLKDYAYAEESGYTYINYDANFDQAVATLKTHVQSRNSAVLSYVN
jgi:spore coat protein H